MKTCRKGLHQYDNSLKRCPECHSIKMKSLYQKNKDKYLSNMRVWKINNPLYKSQSKFNLDKDTYFSLFAAQNGCCKICGNESNNKSLAIDHDHDTGKVRGLLCLNCNVGLGHFKDSIELLEEAMRYLSVSRDL